MKTTDKHQKLLITGTSILLPSKTLLFKAKNYRHAFSEERVYTIINDYLDFNLRKYSRFLYYMVAFLFRSSNFKHSTDIVNGKPLWVWFVDIFCWFCLFAFIGCLIAGVAQPIVSALSQTIHGDFNQIVHDITQSFGNVTSVVLLIFAVLTFSIALFYLHLMRKVVAVNKKYLLKDYLIYKTSFILNWEKLINVQKSTKKRYFKKLIKKGKVKNVAPFCVIENMEIFDDSTRWTILQICNVLNKLFPEFAITLLFNQVTQERSKRLNDVVEVDFKYLKIRDLSPTGVIPLPH
ncbi:hypothetical protein [[Mycoplasma] testudinis]|uniref:hypothetical protein n=1 Tax=[Mycoplasma] testudinis TaxID=33924 RepID=UPI000482D12B|nr:hypothetical protein [[Mycoplasma] testudinis]